MPAGGLLALKNRVKSVKSTKKTTKAMSLISASKMKKARVSLQKNEIFFNNLKHAGHTIFKYADNPYSSLLAKSNGESKKLYIIFASDTGLCGGFNGNGPIYLGKKYEGENLSIILSGKRARYYVNKYGFKIINEYKDPKEKITIKEAKIMASEIVDLFLNHGYGEISIVYTKFFSPSRQTVVEERLLPFKLGEIDDLVENKDFDLDQESEELVEDYIIRHMEAQLINAVYHSKTSEHNARMIAMDNATTNASKMAVELENKYNRLRQGAITQEIAEIIGGVEAINKKTKKKK